MASEDSDQFVPRLLAIHGLSDLRDRDQSRNQQMRVHTNQLHAANELVKVAALRRAKRIALEERNHRSEELIPSPDSELAEVFLVVVVAPVRVDPANAEEITDLLQRGTAALTLRYDKPMEYLVAGRVASPLSPVGLLDETDGEATFPIYEADDPVCADRSFLLVFRTVRIITAHVLRLERVPAGYSGFPAYSQI
jgi:hypothetical protein